MDLSFPDADRIESRCHRRLTAADMDDDEENENENANANERVAETPGAIAPRCREEAATWFERMDGTRVYVCENHALELLRFGDGQNEQDLRDMGYHALRTAAAEAGISLRGPTKLELVARLVGKKSAGDLPDHPRVGVCGECGCFTLVDELGTVERRCVGCLGTRTPLDPTDYGFLPEAGEEAEAE